MNALKTIAVMVVLFSGATAVAAVKGDYVEVRTASVFAGPCHYNGEVVAGGRDAILAWNVTEGEHNGVNLAGVRAVAVVSADANLSDAGAARKSELVIDAASDAQADAFVAIMKEQLGMIVSVKRATVTFKRDKDGYTLDAPGFASASVQPMPNAECCKQPNNVWYEPLTKLEDRRVGYTASAAYAGGKVADRWQRASENSAFYGSFTK